MKAEVNAIGLKVLMECKKRKIKPYRLAKDSNILQTTMNQIVNSKEINPTFETLKKLCNGLNMTLEEFFSDDVFK